MGYKVIGIDHGNGNIKTANTVFKCGYTKQTVKPVDIYTEDFIEYNGAYYLLSEKTFSYEVDKTKNENHFILTMFAIAKELIEQEKIRFGERYDASKFRGVKNQEVVLAVGLPPAHLEKYINKFKEYFYERSKNGLCFKYNDKSFELRIKKVVVLPQDYAACAVFQQKLIKDYRTVYCIDIGDGTVDLITLKDSKVDKSGITSKEMGMSKFRNKMIDEFIENEGITLDNDSINDALAEGVVKNAKKCSLPLEFKTQIKKRANDFSREIVNTLHATVPEFRINPTIFCGGGSELLLPYLEETGMFGEIVHINDIHANAKGYEVLANLMTK